MRPAEFLQRNAQHSSIALRGTPTSSERNPKSPGTWLWSWANEGGNVPEQQQAASLKLKALGEEHGIAELTDSVQWKPSQRLRAHPKANAKHAPRKKPHAPPFPHTDTNATPNPRLGCGDAIALDASEQVVAPRLCLAQR